MNEYKISTIGRELKRTKAFHSRSQEAILSILRTASLIRRDLERLVSRGGLSSPQYNVLRILRGASGELPVMEIASRMIEVEPGISRLIRKLEKKELLTWHHSKADAREKLCTITPAGLDLLDALDEDITCFDDTALGPLGDEELSTLIRTLDKARKRLLSVAILMLSIGKYF